MTAHLQKSPDFFVQKGPDILSQQTVCVPRSTRDQTDLLSSFARLVKVLHRFSLWLPGMPPNMLITV